MNERAERPAARGSGAQPQITPSDQMIRGTDIPVTRKNPIVAGDAVAGAMDSARRGQLCELLRRCGVDPATVRAVGYDVIDGPLLRCEIYDVDEQGHTYERHEAECLTPLPTPPFRYCDCPMAMHTVDVALRAELPDWWRPQPLTAQHPERDTDA